MKEDWTDKLERKLEGYSMEEPEGLWSAIQSSLPAAPAPAVKVHRLRNIFAVAVPSAVAACLGAWLILSGGSDVQSKPQEELIAIDNTRHTTDATAQPEEEMPSLGNVAALVAQAAVAPRIAIVNDAVPYADDNEDVEPVTVPSTDAEPSQPVPVGEEPIYEPSAPAYVPDPVEGWPYQEIEVRRPSRGSRFSMNVGGASDATTSLRGDAVMLACEDATMLKSDPENWNAAEARRGFTGDYHWGISWRVNALAEKYLTDRISVGSGLSWTLVEGTMEYDLDRVQVHYAGIPVVLGADLVDKGSFAIGVSLGATAAWGIASTSDVPVNGLQLSSMAGLNARYRIHRNMSMQFGFAADTFYPTGKREISIFQEPTTILNASLGLVFSFR